MKQEHDQPDAIALALASITARGDRLTSPRYDPATRTLWAAVTNCQGFHMYELQLTFDSPLVPAQRAAT